MTPSHSSPRRDLVPIDRIVSMLAARAPDLAAELLPGGARRQAEWVCGDLRGGPGRSLSVHLAGPKSGVWKDFAADTGGDALDLVAHVLFGRDKGRALRWARGWLGLDGTDPTALRRTRAAVERHDTSDAAAEAEAAKLRGAAQRIYLSGAPIAGTPVDRYLDGRGLAARRFPFPLRSLRYHPELWHAESKRRWPAMVAGMVGPDGSFRAVHRTYLEIQTDGRVTKAPLDPPKLVLGQFRGAAIRLWRGIVVDPETGEIGQAPRLSAVKAPVEIDVTEGIEDGLSVALAVPAARVVAAGTLGNIGNLRLANVGAWNVWAQNDAPDSPAARALVRSLARLRETGAVVYEVRPPEGVKDANDVLRGGTAS
ncbi:MAG TPA: toprim domain-containing protein [Stellaceae bacterium]|nr:toprim domain-containing protein [Stellaceae bacterium]